MMYDLNDALRRGSVTVTVSPANARGVAHVPPSKSMAHRLLIAAALSDGESRIAHVPDNEDVNATIDCLCVLGADCTVESDGHCGATGRTVRVHGCGGRWSPSLPEVTLPCRESGSTLRFLLPLCLLPTTGGEALRVTFSGHGRLPKRPIAPYAELFPGCVGTWETTDGIEYFLSVSAGNTADDGCYRLAGDISSQFVTGLLFYLPLLPGEGETVLALVPPVESRPYIEMTRAVLAKFGVRSAWDAKDPNRLHIPHGQKYCAAGVEAEPLTVPRDESAAAFFEALALLHGGVEIRPERPADGADNATSVADAESRALLERVLRGDTAPRISLADCPDLFPILCVAAALGHGAVFTHVRRLRFKESDRLDAMTLALTECGADLSLSADGSTLTVRPAPLASPQTPLDGCGDHRVVMALSVLGSVIGTRIRGAEAVSKSFPTFFSELAGLGISLQFDETEI